MLLVDGEGQLQVAAYVGNARDAVMATFPRGRRFGAGPGDHRGSHRPHVDVMNDPVAGRARRMGTVAGYHSVAFAPMLWEGRGIGVVGVARSRGAFSDKELALLQTFADQAVIAIQNDVCSTRPRRHWPGRRRRPTCCASSAARDRDPARLRRDRATAAILLQERQPRAVLWLAEGERAAASPGRRQNGGKLADQGEARLTRIDPRREPRSEHAWPMLPNDPLAELLDQAAEQSTPTTAPCSTVSAAALHSVHLRAAASQRRGHGRPGGPGAARWVRSTPRYVALVEHLRRPGGDRGRERSHVPRDQGSARAADGDGRDPACHQLARSTDTQPVFDAIVQSCRRFSPRRAPAGCTWRCWSANMIQDVAFPAAWARGGAEGRRLPRSLWPLDPRQRRPAPAILEGRVIRVADYRRGRQAWFSRMPVPGRSRSALPRALFVPLLRDGKALGSLDNHCAKTTGEFDAKEIALGQTFADQAVIAIENARLFDETHRRRSSGRSRPPRCSRSSAARRPTSSRCSNALAERAVPAWAMPTAAACWLVVGGRLRAMTQLSGGSTPRRRSTRRRRCRASSIGGSCRSSKADRSTSKTSLPLLGGGEYPDVRQLPGYATASRSVLAVPMMREGRADRRDLAAALRR